MARRFLSRDYVNRELERLGCKFVKQYVTTALWETASGVWFTVPHHTAERKTAEDTFQSIIKDIEKWNLFTGTEPSEV